MIRKYMLAMIQMDTQNDKGINLEQASAWIDEAALRGVKLVCFPEVMNLIGRNVGEGGGREQIPGYTTDILCRKAKEHGIYIHGGSITEELPGEKRSANTSVLISPEGKYWRPTANSICLTSRLRTVHRLMNRIKSGRGKRL